MAFPEPDVAMLGFVGLVPLLLAVAGAPTPREAGLRAWLGGTGFFVAMHHWLLPNVGVFTVAIGPALGLMWMPWGWTVRAWMHDVGSPRHLVGALLVVPAVWVTVEFARSWDRFAGPWGLLGASQWQNLRVLSLAALGGIWLVSMVLMAVNVGAAIALNPRTRPRLRVAAGACALALVAGSYGFGFLRHRPAPVATAEIVGVQTGRIEDVTERFDAHIEASEAIAPPGLDLLVWGESSVGFDLETRPRRVEQIEEVARTLGAEVLVNVDARRGGAGGIFKSSLLVGRDGIRDRYDKIRLVPFGEYVPLRFLFGWTSAVTEAAEEDRRRGDALAVLETPLDEGGPLQFGPLVCFESAFPDMSRELVRDGADVIVVQTATTTFQGSWGQSQHAALSAVRAVEVGRPVVHAALSGVSAVYDATGRQLAWLDSDETGAYRVSLPITSGRTPFVRFRDWVPALCVGIILSALLAAGLGASRRRSG